MSKVLIISRRKLWFIACCAVLFVFVGIWWRTSGLRGQHADTTPTKPRLIQMVTGEFSSKTPDGRVIEAYRWDPGTIYVHQGEWVKLSIYGVNGDKHPFIIQGLNIEGEVVKGQETILTFKAEEEGVFPIICLTHPDIAHHGPMVGYIVVD